MWKPPILFVCMPTMCIPQLAVPASFQSCVPQPSHSFTWQSHSLNHRHTTTIVEKSNLISGTTEKKPVKPPSKSSGRGKLLNTSSIARQLAHGKGPINRSVTNAVLSGASQKDPPSAEQEPSKPRDDYSVLFLFSLCECPRTRRLSQLSEAVAAVVAVAVASC